MSEKLKPCPFCGGEAVVHYMAGGLPLGVRCLRCGTLTLSYTTDGDVTPEGAIKAWNNRDDGQPADCKEQALA